jgi:hypothetical protein
VLGVVVMVLVVVVGVLLGLCCGSHGSAARRHGVAKQQRRQGGGLGPHRPVGRRGLAHHGLGMLAQVAAHRLKGSVSNKREDHNNSALHLGLAALDESEKSAEGLEAHGALRILQAGQQRPRRVAP